MPKKFKWRKPKPMEDKPATDHKNAERQKESAHAKIIVATGVKIDLVNDLRKQHEAEYNETTSHNKKQLRWTKVAAGLVFLYTVITLLLYVQAKRSADAAKYSLTASNRAWVKVSMAHPWTDREVPFSKAIDDAQVFAFRHIVQNIGKSPAKDVRIFGWVELLNRDQSPSFQIPSRAMGMYRPILYPGDSDEEFNIILTTRIVDNRPMVAEFNETIRGQLKASEQYIVVYGSGSYSDDFGEYEFAFCSPLLNDPTHFMNHRGVSACFEHNVVKTTKTKQ